jgi:predicted DNA-binding transcriptional regulator YafY
VNRIDRLLATILLLQSQRVTKAEEVAEHFEISLRTVYRDIAALSEAGVPIIAEAGVGYSLLKGYFMPPVMFSAEEASALFMGGELVEHLTDPSLQAQMQSALQKIRSVLPRDRQDHLDRLKGSTALLIAPRRQGEESQAVLTRIQSALAQRRVLKLEYRTRGEEEATPREVEPLGLIYYSGHWHLIAYCRLREDMRDFRTDRIANLEMSHESFSPREGFSARDYLDSRCERADTVEVKLKFTGQAIDRARRFWFAGMAEEQKTSDGLIMTFPAGGLEWIAGWLLSFGPQVEVIAPTALRTLVIERAMSLARHHSGCAELASQHV